MKIITKPTYKCDHCGKLYQLKHFCKAHEPKCRKNPINNNLCLGCDNLEKREVKTYREVMYLGENLGVGYDTPDKIRKLCYCSEKEIYVYPSYISNPLLSEDIEDEVENEVMPNSCDKFKEKEY
jgi:hypothetical protein